MEELIRNIQQEWQKAKDAAQERCVANGDLHLAQKLADCKMFKGTEDLKELIMLMFTPQGIEFLTKYNSPDIGTFRKFKKYHPERYGVYIDYGEISLSEARNVFFGGKLIRDTEIPGSRKKPGLFDARCECHGDCIRLLNRKDRER